MSVLQNINGTLYRMDASDLVQLAAVDTEGILGGTPGATTDGQTLVDQLAADDVQAQTDIGQIRTDLSDLEDDMSEYHVVPSRNLCPFYTNVVGGFTYTPDENGYTSCSSASDTRSWSYSVSNILFRLPAGSYHFHVFAKTAYTSGYTGARVYDSANNLIGGLANFDSDMGFDFTLAATTDLGLIYKLGNGSYAFMVSTASNWSVNNTYEPYYVCMRDGKLDITDEQVLGAWNMLDNRLTTQTNSGITVTVGSKKEVRVTTGSSAPTQLVNFRILPEGVGLGNLVVGKTYYLTGCPAGGLGGIYCLVIGRDHPGGSFDTLVDSGDGLQFTYDGSWTCRYVLLQIGTPVGANFDKTFYPMITTKKGAPYVPYAMTNRELTDAIRYTIANFPTATGSSYYLHKVGRLGILTMVMVLSDVTADTWTLVGTIASGARPITAYFFACYAADTNNVVQGLLETDGSIKIKAHTGGSLNIRGSVAYVIA